MNILRVPDAKLATSGSNGGAGDKFKPTSCEGYVTKRGHFRKSWRVRYLVFNGADLQVAYYESRDASKGSSSSGGTGVPVPKGSFYVSSVEKHEYWVGVMGGREKPFGFKLVGHAPKKGYIELDIFVESLGDLNKWVEVVQNALDAAKKRSRTGGFQDNSTTKTMFGFSASASPQLQVKKLAATKEDLLRDALREIEGAKLIGREAVNEIVVQGEKLDMVESDLGKVEGDLDHADKLLRHMKRPMLHLFSGDERAKQSPHTGGASGHTDRASHGQTPGTTNGGTTGGQQIHGQRNDALSDLEKLALALGELEEQANLMNAEAVKSTEQIARVEQRLTAVNDRVQTQTKKANATMKAGNLF